VDLEVRARIKASRDAGSPARVTREERAALRKDLHDELLRQAAPSIEAHAVVVDPDARTACVFTLSKAANEAFRALFRDTFDVDAVPLPPRAALRLARRGPTLPRRVAAPEETLT
jgi:hypothetical protein